MVTLIERGVTISLYGPYKELDCLVEQFKFAHPRRFVMVAHQLWRQTGGKSGWDGFLKPLSWSGQGECSVLRGHKDRLLSVMHRMNIELSPQSQLLESPFKDITTDDIPDDCITADYKLDQTQRATVAAWLKHGMGVGHLATNFGKTACFSAFTACLKALSPEARVLYITDRERLTSQVDKEMRKMLPWANISKYGGGGNNPNGKDVVVCTLAMVRTHLDDLVANGWVKTFNAILFDESAHASAAQSLKILEAIGGAFFRVGASATTKENDEIARTQITGLLGPVRVTLKSEVLIASGRSATPHIYLVDNREWEGRFRHVPTTAAPGTPAWALLEGNPQMVQGVYKGPVYERDEKGEIKTKKKQELEQTEREVETEEGIKVEKSAKVISVDVPITVPGLYVVEIGGLDYEVKSSYVLLERTSDKAIVRFKERNDLICAWAKHFSDQGKRCLVVATRTMHILLLESKLCEIVNPDLVRILTGEDSSKARDEVIAWFKATPGAVLVSSIIKEGVSINEIQSGIIADSVADSEVGAQILGRFLRKKLEGSNICELVWFVDRQHSRYSKNSIDLMEELMKSKGLLVWHPVILPDDIKDAVCYDTTAEIEAAENVHKKHAKA